MDIVLQIWGGGFYLTNKICFAFAEGRTPKLKRQLKIIGWVVYILGVPAWVIILAIKHNWIAASIEFGGVPAMLLGLFTTWRNHLTPHRLFDRVAAFSTYTFIIIGTVYSIYDFKGITSVSQVLEFGVMIGFLLGSYLLAKNSTSGWLFFVLMNGSMGTLMLIQGKPILALQQAVSLGFVVFGFLSATRNKTINKT